MESVRTPQASASDALTDTHCRMLRYAAQGFSNAEIAKALNLREKTVKNYMSEAYRRLGIEAERHQAESARTLAVVLAAVRGYINLHHCVAPGESAALALHRLGRYPHHTDQRMLRVIGPTPGVQPWTVTRRERDVLRLILEGLNGREIARTLGVQYNYIRQLTQNCLWKLDVHNRTAAAVKARRLGLI